MRATLLLEQIDDALLVPRQAVFDREGSSVVYRKNGEGFEPVKVKLGPSTMGRVVVESGIKPGEGAVVDHDGKKVAAYHDPEAGLRTMSARCTHMGCIVAFNSAIRRAIHFEIARQTEELDLGIPQIQSTRRWDDDRGETQMMRLALMGKPPEVAPGRF